MAEDHEIEFHERDPTVHLWLRLLPKGRKPRGPMSKEQKRIRSIKSQIYYIDHPSYFTDIYKDSEKEDEYTNLI